MAKKKSRKIKVLIIDDQKIIGDLFEFTLGFKGYAITFADSAHSALALLEKEKFDIAFLDIVMPGIDGVDTFKTVRAKAPDLPIVIMSGYSVDSKRKQAIELGAVACLVKPFEIEEAIEIIHGTVKKRRKKIL